MSLDIHYERRFTILGGIFENVCLMFVCTYDSLYVIVLTDFIDLTSTPYVWEEF